MTKIQKYKVPIESRQIRKRIVKSKMVEIHLNKGCEHVYDEFSHSNSIRHDNFVNKVDIGTIY